MATVLLSLRKEPEFGSADMLSVQNIPKTNGYKSIAI